MLYAIKTIYGIEKNVHDQIITYNNKEETKDNLKYYHETLKAEVIEIKED